MLGRSHVGGNGNSSQYSCLENPMDQGAWWATVHGVAESDRLKWLSMHARLQEVRLFRSIQWPPRELAGPGAHPCLNTNLASVASKLCGPGQVTSPLWAPLWGLPCKDRLTVKCRVFLRLGNSRWKKRGKQRRKSTHSRSLGKSRSLSDWVVAKHFPPPHLICTTSPQRKHYDELV